MRQKGLFFSKYKIITIRLNLIDRLNLTTLMHNVGSNHLKWINHGDLKNEKIPSNWFSSFCHV